MLASIFNRQVRNAIASTSRLRLDSALPPVSIINNRLNFYATDSTLTETKKAPKPRSRKGIRVQSKREKRLKRDDVQAIFQETEINDPENEIVDEEEGFESSSNVGSGMMEDDFDTSSVEDQGAKLCDSVLKKPSITGSKGAFERDRRAAKEVIPDPTQPLPHVPAKEKWGRLFYKTPGVNSRHRMFIHNVATAKKIIKALNLEEQSENSGKKLTIIEGYPGVGALTREFLQQECVEKVITLERQFSFFQAMENLLKDPNMPRNEEKLINVPMSCFHWDTYDHIIEKGILDNIPSVRENRNSLPDYSQGFFTSDSWQKPSSILFLAQLPNTVHSEQLLSQLMRAVSNRYWLYRYSRIRMAFICSEQLGLRCLAQPGERLYSKFSLVTGAVAESSIALEAKNFLPHPDHFWPPTPELGPQLPTTVQMSTIKDHRIRPTPAKEQQCLLILEPKVKPLLEGSSELESFDYLTRNLFVLRTHTMKEALKHLAPGAINILEMMRSGKHPAMREMRHVQIDSNQKVNELTVEQMVALSKMFDRWPFRPSSLLEDGRIEDISDRFFQ